jgi:hypothetical protein
MISFLFRSAIYYLSQFRHKRLALWRLTMTKFVCCAFRGLICLSSRRSGALIRWRLIPIFGWRANLSSCILLSWFLNFGDWVLSIKQLEFFLGFLSTLLHQLVEILLCVRPSLGARSCADMFVYFVPVFSVNLECFKKLIMFFICPSPSILLLPSVLSIFFWLFH